MATPILFFAEVGCDKCIHLPDCCSNDVGFFSTIAFDALLSLTCLVVGILALQGTVALPPAGAYSLIGVSSVITLLWIALAAYGIKQACRLATN